MATLTPQQVVRTGLEATFSAAAGGGDVFPNTGREIVEIVNGGGSDITLTVVTPGTYLGQALADDAIVVTAGERRHVGPFPPEMYNNASGQVALAYSGVTTVTVAILTV